MLSSEIATLLSGRYVEIKMLPLSFREYVEASGSKDELQKKYLKYIETSSFPYALALQNQEKELRNYLESLFHTIVIKDIANKNKIGDIMMLESVVRFVFDNIGNRLSSKKISDTMTSNGRKISVKTVEKYLRALSESFVVYQAKRYNIKGKSYLKTHDKYYLVDVGLRQVLLGSKSHDVGHILENIIYLELIRRHYDVYVGKFDEYEVDFVAMHDKGLIYYQVAASVRDEKTLERELKSLKKINDSYPKYLLTLDEDPFMEFDGIIKLNAIDWLMSI